MKQSTLVPPSAGYVVQVGLLVSWERQGQKQTRQSETSLGKGQALWKARGRTDPAKVRNSSLEVEIAGLGLSEQQGWKGDSISGGENRLCKAWRLDT